MSKIEDIKKMIQHYLRLTSEMEKRRTQFGFLFILQFFIALILVIFVSVIFIIPLLFSVVAFYVFLFQCTYRYPFNVPGFSFGNQLKWFYRGDVNLLKINKRNFNKQFIDSFNDLLKLYNTETEPQEFYNDLIQMHILRVHNMFKNKFYLALVFWQKIITLSWTTSILIFLLNRCSFF